jgi:hypothetical protein
MHIFAGLKINVHPSVLSMRRSWTDRLFSWPWRPWIDQELVPNPLFTDGKCYQVGDTIIMTDVQYDALRKGAAYDAGLLDREPTRFDI